MPRFTIKTGKDLARDLEASVRADGYRMLEKSRWVSEAIVEFVKARGTATELWEVGTGDDLDGYSVKLTFTLSDDAMKAIERSVSQIRKSFPLEEGVRSSLVRAAIRARIGKVRKEKGRAFDQQRNMVLAVPTRRRLTSRT